MFDFFGNKEEKLDMENIPRHIAIIMDGNGRWAAKKGLSKKMGHKAGAQALERVCNAAEKLGVEYITVYAFSTENWKRSAEEVKDIMDLLRSYLQSYIDDSEKNNIKIRIIGDKTMLDDDIKEKIIRLEALSESKSGMNLNIGLNYGGRDEIVRAVKEICGDFQNEKIKIGEITEELFGDYLDTRAIPDPELLIRTSGEERISNFLLWQVAYSEFVFSDRLWPDFQAEDLEKAIIEYQCRNRRFGGR